jgi:hypothetical protein
MIRHLASVLATLFVLASVSGAVVSGHDGHEHKIMGTVTMAAADHVMLTDTDGKAVTVQVTKDTKVTRDKQAIKAQDIKAGTRVVVTAISEKDQMMAKEILVGAEAKTVAR